MKCAPKIMTTIAATVLKMPWFDKKSVPTADAANPMIKKTLDNPKTKNKAGKIADARALPDCKSTRLTPLIYAKYGGTIGNTHGLKKEISPAISATNIAGNTPASKRSIPNINVFYGIFIAPSPKQSSQLCGQQPWHRLKT